MRCPGCAAEIPVEEKLAHLVVCQYCSSMILLDKKAARLSGKMAVLAQPDSDLRVGGAGRYQNVAFRIVGRIRFGYRDGYWDEWLLAFDDGTSVWVSEDEGNYTLEILQQLPSAPIPFKKAQAGETVVIGGHSFHIDEKGTSILEGAQGQIPFLVRPGQQVPYLDLTGEDRRFGTLEYTDTGTQFYEGRHIALGDLNLDPRVGEKSSAGLDAEREASDGARERVVRKEGRSEKIPCTGCGGMLEPPAPGATSLQCKFCGRTLDLNQRQVDCPRCKKSIVLQGGAEAKSARCARCEIQLDVSKAQPSILFKLVTKQRPLVPFKIGDEGVFDRKRYRILGHLRYLQQDEDGSYLWDEFILFNPEEGYVWLVLENGHFSLARPLKDRPPQYIGGAVKESFDYQDRTWKVFEMAEARLTWVDGELPWVAKVGDKVEYADCIAPPLMLSRERTRTKQSDEVEWFVSEYLTQEQVRLAFFDKRQLSLPDPEGIAPNQPNLISRFRREAVAVFLVFLLLSSVMIGRAMFSFMKTLNTTTLEAGDYAEENLISPFEADRAGLYQAVFSSPVENSWVGLDVAIVDAEDQVLFDFDVELSYYHGVEGGESWTEGSKTADIEFVLPRAGQYRLLVKGVAGYGELPAEKAQKSITITLKSGVILARYYAYFAAFCALWLLIELFRRGNFEARRWAGSGDAEGEDDDD